MLTYAGNHGYPDLIMKAGIEAAKEKPVEVLIYAVRGSHDDLVKVVQPKAIDRDPLQIMKIADDLGVDGLGEAAAYSAIERGSEFQVLEYAVQHEFHALTDAATARTLYNGSPLTEAAKWLSHRTLVAWVCT